MRRIALISFLITIFNTNYILSQTNENLSDGYKVFKYPNGTVSGEGNIRNGKPVTGVKKSEGRRTNFLLDSIWVFYDQTGDTLRKINYLFDKKNGYYYEYKKDPVEGLYIWSKELFAGDKKEGMAYLYFPDHRIKQTFA
jgi:antitoxin component YwqK of YwqJK toxin-antitoxin module